MNILFRADSSSSIGTGHIMRNLVLAQKYYNKGHNITFATQELYGNINFKIIEASYKLEILKSNEIEELIELIKKLYIDMIVIDNYSIDYLYEKKLKQETDIEIFVVDDTYEKHHCDILLNHNIYAQKEKYFNLVPQTCELRCGSKYTLLRDEFINIKKNINSNYITFFLAMGGGDILNLNIKILEILENFNNECIRVNLITTESNNNLEELKKYCKNRQWITLYVNYSFVAKLMASSDYGIITPSVTANEAYTMKLPFVAIKVAENQNYMYEYLKNINYSVIDKFNKEDLNRILQEKILYKCELVDFIDLNKEEKEMILDWRNQSNIRKWMYSKDIISLESHLSYIQSLITSQDKKYFLVKHNNKNIGIIDFVNITKVSAGMGLYANPKCKGVGNILMQNILQYAFRELKVKKIFAEVFSENKRAYELYKSFDFKVYDSKVINEKEIISMELKHEDR